MQSQHHNRGRSLRKSWSVGRREAFLVRPRRLSMEMLEHRLALATLLVTSAADSGDGSLRLAIEQANGTSGADAITFDASLAGQSIVLGGTELSISDDLTITGLGADDLTISANNASRVFSVAPGVTVEISAVTVADGQAVHGGGIYNQGTLTVAHCTFTENCAKHDNYWYPADGGAIWSNSWLTLTDSIFSENSSTFQGGAIQNLGTLDITNATFLVNTTRYNGGAIANVDGALAITGSTFSENSCMYYWGGAIYSYGDSSPGLQISNSIFTNNQAGIGGAIYNRVDNADVWSNISDSRFESNDAWGNCGGAIENWAPMTVTNCTFEENSARSHGGAIDHNGSILKVFNSTFSGNSSGYAAGAIENAHGTLQIANSTISDNKSDCDGGGILNNDGTLRITNSTIVGNRADADRDGYGTGGGLCILSSEDSPNPILDNTILAGNVRGRGRTHNPDDIYGALDPASSNNLIGDAASAGGLVHGVNGNIVGNAGIGTIDTDTVLDPNLADNGGPTLTHALVPGGLAVNAGNNDEVVSDYDQRGEGFPRIYADTVDIGAFEVQSWFAQIDIKPGSDPTSINNASVVDASTVAFAGASAAHSAMEDVDGDGDLDMVLHFRVQDTNLADIYAQLVAEDSSSSHQQLAVSLTGKTIDGEAFEGMDAMDAFFSGRALRELLDELALAGVL